MDGSGGQGGVRKAGVTIMKGSPKRTGFCRLIDVLAVLCMVAVVLDILFPLVQKVRRASANAVCCNNLHNIIIATHDYCDCHQSWLPVGTLVNPALAPDQRLSWTVTILPFLE